MCLRQQAHIAAEKNVHTTKRKEVMFLGDFNIDVLTESESSAGSSYSLSNSCDQFYLSNTISVPTRVTPATKTLLDVILVSHPERFVSSGTLRLGLNDHDLIYIVRKQTLPKANEGSMEYRSMKNFDEPAILSSLSDIPLDTAHTFNDVIIFGATGKAFSSKLLISTQRCEP